MLILISEKPIVPSIEISFAYCANNRQNRQLTDILFGFCEDCRKMAAIPHGAFAACKLRAQGKNDMVVSKLPNTEKQGNKTYTNSKLTHYAPVKYNDKLMNSIWGLYNRYSPHNIKSNDDEMIGQKINLQQPLAVAAYTISQDLGIGTKNGSEWKFPGPKK